MKESWKTKLRDWNEGNVPRYVLMIFIGCIFILVSLQTLLELGVYSVQWVMLKPRAVYVEATITQIYEMPTRHGTIHSVYIEYADGSGEVHEGKLGYYKQSMKTGDTVVICYDAKAPERFMAHPIKRMGGHLDAGIPTFLLGCVIVFIGVKYRKVEYTDASGEGD